jgi:ABC-type uncharacterized transport system permease subunit
MVIARRRFWRERSRPLAGVNEIFGGLGFNFVATALTLWLIFGPWSAGIGSMSGTEPFPQALVAPNRQARLSSGPCSSQWAS